MSKFDAGGDIVLCMTQLNLSARAYHRTQSVKLARTIADLPGCEEIPYEKEIDPDRWENNLHASDIGIQSLQFDKNG